MANVTAPDEYYKFLNSFIGDPSKREIKQLGEVFTPVTLIEEILSKFPKDIWTNPSLTWLDVAAGIGPFGYCIYQRLMIGLSTTFPDRMERERHILENMIYFIDIRERNVNLLKEIFQGHIYKLNIYQDDFITWNEDMKFDCIVSNPPYNDGSGNKGRGHTLWTKFVEKSLKKHLKSMGFMSYINPSLWRQPNHPLQKILKEKQILYLEIHSEKDGNTTFKCNTRYDWYVLQNCEYRDKTHIKTQIGEDVYVDLREWDFIPNYHYDLLSQLTKGDKKVEIMKSRSNYGTDKKWTSKEYDDTYKYPIVNSINRKNIPTLIYSSINTRGMFGIPKVIFAGGATGFIVDSDGRYGLSEWATGIVDGIENLENIKKCLESSLFKEIKFATSVSKAEINSKVLFNFRKDFWKILLEYHNNSPQQPIPEQILSTKSQDNKSSLNRERLLIPSRHKGSYTIKDLKKICLDLNLTYRCTDRHGDLIKLIKEHIK